MRRGSVSASASGLFAPRGGALTQCEDRAAALAPRPAGLALDERGARADAGQSPPFERAFVGGAEAAAVVRELEEEVARVVQMDAQRDAFGLRVATDVTDGLLHDAIDLHLHAGRERQTLFKVFVADEVVSEPVRRGLLRAGSGDEPFERGGKPDVLKHRRREVFADASHLLRDGLYLRAQSRRVGDRRPRG